MNPPFITALASRTRLATKLAVLTAACLFLLFTTSGCNSLRGYPKRPVAESAELKHLLPYFIGDVLEEYKEIATKPEGQTEAQISARRRDYRDGVILARMRAYDLGFEIFEKAIHNEKNASTVVTDWAALGVSGYGAVGGGAATKAILHAISGGLTGARLVVDKTAYYEKTMPALLAQMEASRSQMRANIRAALKQSAEQYPLAAALQDLDLYYKVGTIPGAVIAINKSAGADAKKSDKELKSLMIEGSFQRDDASKKLRQYVLDAQGKYITANQKKLEEWLKGKKLEVEIGVFLSMKNFAEARAQAVKDLKIE